MTSQETQVIVVGSGSSAGTPLTWCLTRVPITCTVCLDATTRSGSKNHRRNPSLLLMKNGTNVLIDCGKSFKEAMIKVAMEHNIKKILML